MTEPLINAWYPDGTWVGSFVSAEYAKEWLTNAGYKIDECEVSNRRYVRPEKKEE
jgi:hypothetical protein